MISHSPGPILVIDGDTSARALIVSWLQADGLDVVTADTADEGFALLAREPALVIGELMAPIASGEQLLKALLRDLPLTSAIVLTDEAALDQAISALKAGASDFLLKSLLNQDILHLSVLRAIERRQLRVENRQYRAALEQANTQLQQSLQLLEQDQRAGLQVQTKLLPPTPHQTNGMTLAHVIKPSLYLSGDFVDYFSLGPNRTAFYLADVSGHGASSAFVTVFLKTLTNRIRRHFEKRTAVLSLSPARIMAAMNEELRALGTGKHLTVFCGMIDTTQNLLTYCLGAHYPPPMLCQGGSIEVLAGTGLPLGLFPDARYEEYHVKLQPHFSLVALSDGILEVLPAGDLVAKEARLRAAVAEADGEIEKLFDLLGLQTVRDIPDDIALLMIKRDE